MITKITQGPPALTSPPPQDDGGTYRYGVAFPFQVAPRKAALTIALRVEGTPVGDFENGCDVVLFDGLSRIDLTDSVPITRNEKFPGKEPRLMLRYPTIGGFVPCGALRPDGTPHPHAGTGFGFNEALDFPMLDGSYYDKAHKTTEMIRHTEIHQLAYDGKRFSVNRTDLFSPTNPLKAPGSDWALTWPGLKQGIPDGDDLLFPVLATAGDPSTWMSFPMASGVARWRRLEGRWQPVSFVPIIGSDDPTAKPPFDVVYNLEIPCMWMEPSIVRDLDGSLLFSARACYDGLNNTLRVWHSGDGAATWNCIIDLPEGRAQSTVTLNQAVDGTPYVVANALGRERDLLCVWPLSDDRCGLGEPITVRNALDEFGTPPSGIVWFVDHPNANTVQLADGDWHHILSYRIMDRGEHSGGDPTPQTGQYLEEVISSGPARPDWRFA